MQQREKVSFEPNVPVPVTLEFDDGVPVPGRFGDQYQYFLGDEKIMWVDPPLRDKIRATGAAAGDEVYITRQETRQGRRKSVDWVVERVEDEPAGDMPLPPPPDDDPEAALAESTRRFVSEPAPAPAPKPAARAQQRSAPPARAAAARAAEPPTPAPLHSPITACLTEALAAVRTVEDAAAASGRPLVFSTADIRALAVTLYIRRQEGR